MFAVYIKNPKALAKGLDRTPSYLKEKIAKAINELGNYPNLNQLKKLSNGGYRVRVGDYRILFDVDSKKKIIMVYHLAHRREVYR